jgi:hypothetical protein
MSEVPLYEHLAFAFEQLGLERLTLAAVRLPPPFHHLPHGGSYKHIDIYTYKHINIYRKIISA